MATNDYLPYLQHHGILGMKWGVRRYQNEDGSLTGAGRRRYGKAISKEYKKEFRKNFAENMRTNRPGLNPLSIKNERIKEYNRSKAMSDAIETTTRHVKEDISSNRVVDKKTLSDFRKAALDSLKYDPRNLDPDTLGSGYWTMALKQQKSFDRMDEIADKIVKSITPGKLIEGTSRAIGRDAILQLGSDIWDKNVSILGTGINDVYKEAYEEAHKSK